MEKRIKMTSKTTKDKMNLISNLPKGGDNLQQQLKEIKEESFKQGIFKERERIEKLIDEWAKIYLIGFIKILKSRING